MARMVLVRTTVATQAQARELADRLVGEGLAACVHTQAIRSSYVWKGRREDGEEYYVEARALARSARKVARRMAEGHPYETPLIETVRCSVNQEYLDWARRPPKA